MMAVIYLYTFVYLCSKMKTIFFFFLYEGSDYLPRNLDTRVALCSDMFFKQKGLKKSCRMTAEIEFMPVATELEQELKRIYN